jgi:hypothetical protein
MVVLRFTFYHGTGSYVGRILILITITLMNSFSLSLCLKSKMYLYGTREQVPFLALPLDCAPFTVHRSPHPTFQQFHRVRHLFVPDLQQKRA